MTVIIVSSAAVILMTSNLFTLPSKNVVLVSLNLALMGFFAIPFTPIAFGFCVELTYPTPEAVSNGMMLLPSKIYGSLLALLSGLAATYSPRYALGIFIGNALICLVCSFFLKEELRRLRPKEVEQPMI
jgi:hypothetical protein